MKHIKVAVIILFFNVTNTYAGRGVNDFFILHYTTENGLPQNSVKAIASDGFGFYWLATEVGLVRFDGQSFNLFDKAKTGISSNRFTNIVKDFYTGRLLAITEKWSTLSVDKGKPVLSAKSIQEHFRMTGARVSSRFYFHRTWEFAQERNFSFRQDTLFLPVSRDRAILMTEGRILWLQSGKRIAGYPVPKEFGFGSVFNIGQNIYKLSSNGKPFEVQHITEGGISATELTGDILLQQEKAPRVICTNNATGQVFISSGSCFYLVERDAKGNLNTRLLLTGFDFNKKVITAACYDKEHDMILLGSMVDGLYVFKRKDFQARVIHDLASSYNVVRDQIVYNDSSILTDKGIVFSAGVLQPYFLPEAKAKMKYSGSWITKTQHSIWAVSGNILYRYTPDFTTLLQKWTLDFVATELAEVQGELWLAAPGHIFSIDYAAQNSGPRLVCNVKAHIQTIKEYQGYAWIGTDAGLYRFNLADHKITTFDLFRNKTVRGLYPLGEDELWICTYDAGFYLYQGKEIKHFPSDKNNYLNTAHCILEDKKRRFWISTNHGIFMIPRKDLLTYGERPAPTPYYLHYNSEAGFISNEFNGGNNRSGVKLPNGAFCFSSMKGWVFFYPDSIKGEFPDKEMIIDRVETGNAEVPFAGSLALVHDFDPVTITIATAYFGNPDNLQYEYRFDNGKWIALKSNQVTFNAMSSGSHTLAIRKRAGWDGLYSIKTLKIEVVPAWWETWIFRAALLVTFLILLWFAFRLRFFLLKKRNKHLEEAVAIQTQKLKDNIYALKQSEEKLTKENKFQQRLTNHIAHDIRTPLKYLTFSSEHLYQSIKRKESPKVQDALEVYMASEQIFQFTGRLISYLNAWTVTNQPKESINIVELIEQKFNIFSLAAKKQNIELVNLIPAHQTIFSHSILIDILLHNLLDNSIKNTTEGSVTFDFAAIGRDAVITLADTGKGIHEEEMKAYNEYLNEEYQQENGTYTGLGFSVIKNILPLISARLILLQNEPQGIIVRLTIQSAFK